MFSASLAILANLPPPSVRVDIPFDRERWHELAAPIFFSLAAFLAGWWLFRSRTVQSVYGLVLLLSSLGSLAIAYTACWIWQNRGEFYAEPEFAQVLATDMHLMWFLILMLGFLVWRWRVRLHRLSAPEAPSSANTLGTWREELLAAMMVLGAVATPFLAPGRVDMWHFLIAAFWLGALAIWLIVIGIAWVWVRS